MSKQQRNQRHIRSKKTPAKIPKGAILLDTNTRDIIQNESQFLALQPEEYCKLVMICAQVLRETAVQAPLSDSTMLRNIIGSPLLLSLVRTFATNYLSSALSDVLSSQKQQSNAHQLPQAPNQSSPYGTRYPPYSFPPIPEWSEQRRMQQTRPMRSENSSPWTFF